MTDEVRRDIERGFVRRGVPQLIEGYATEARMDASAAPYISAWLLIGTALYWGTRPDWPPLLNLAGIAGTIAFITLGYVALMLIRRRPVLTRPTTFDLLDILTMGLLPGVAAAVIDWSPRELLITTLNALLGIGIIYVVVGFGVIEILLWGAGRLGAQLTAIVGLVARTLPVLLILVVFLLFAAEIWQVAAALSAAEMGAIVVLLGLAAALVVVSAARAELQAMETRTDIEVMRSEAMRTAARPVAIATKGHPFGAIPPLSGLERGNLLVLMLFSQLLQSAFVALVVGAFLAALGLLLLPSGIQQEWAGQPVRVLLEFTMVGEERALSAELLTVTGLLGGIVGVYFTGLAVADSSYRPDHFGRVVDEVRELVSTRAIYVGALRAAAAPSPFIAAGDEPRNSSANA